MAPLHPTASAFADLQAQFYACEKTNKTLEVTVESLQECCHELQQEVRQKTLSIQALRETIDTLDGLYQERALRCERLELKLSSLTFDPTPLREVEEEMAASPVVWPPPPVRKKKKTKSNGTNNNNSSSGSSSSSSGSKKEKKTSSSSSGKGSSTSNSKKKHHHHDKKDKQKESASSKDPSLKESS